MLDLILTNEERMIDNQHVKDPLGHSDHCVMEFQFKRYFEQCNIAKKVGTILKVITNK